LVVQALRLLGGQCECSAGVVGPVSSHAALSEKTTITLGRMTPLTFSIAAARTEYPVARTAFGSAPWPSSGATTAA
jgi:hypothetical protein